MTSISFAIKEASGSTANHDLTTGLTNDIAATPEKSGGNDNFNSNLRPFLKWAGSKWSLLPQLKKYLPEPGTFGSYHEPFLGSGSVFLGLYAEWLHKQYLIGNDDHLAFLSDANPKLINAWKNVQFDLDELLERLNILFCEDWSKHYYFNRDAFNSVEGMNASLFIYLNRCCFNGLYRENQKGDFNVPVGQYKRPKAPIEQVRAVSKILEGVDIRAQSYPSVLPLAEAGDFVYFDPPYYPVSDQSFTGYHGQFREPEHGELAALVKQLTANGVQVAVSNSDCPEVHQLYEGFRIETIQRSGRISSKGSDRQPVTELLIMNW